MKAIQDQQIAVGGGGRSDRPVVKGGLCGDQPSKGALGADANILTTREDPIRIVVRNVAVQRGR